MGHLLSLSNLPVTSNNLSTASNQPNAASPTAPSRPTIDPREAEILRAFALGKPREFILAHPEIKLSLWQRIRYHRLLRKRAADVPLAYLTGHKEFFDLDFLVNRAVLIPRPETETLVEAALTEMQKSGQSANQTVSHTQPCPILHIDVGTGTGCIPIAILKKLPPKCAANISVYAIDSSRAALRLAHRNARRHGVSISLVRSNLLHGLNFCTDGENRPQFILITANLPYLTNEEYANEPSLSAEPRSTLVGGGSDGLNLYRELVRQLAALRKETSTVPFTILCEINPGQSEALQNILQFHFPRATVEFKKDLAGWKRVALLNVR